MLPGTLDLRILKADSLGEPHGYAVLQRIERTAGGPLQVRHGALYRLEHPGRFGRERRVSGNDRRAGFYRLTPTRRARPGEEVASWNGLADAIAPALRTKPQEIRG